MLHTSAPRIVPKDLMFKLRLDAQDRERLEAVAAHYSAPAATAIRILVKEKYDAIRRKAAKDTVEPQPPSPAPTDVPSRPAKPTSPKRSKR
jgi:hypothetical protein